MASGFAALCVKASALIARDRFRYARELLAAMDALWTAERNTPWALPPNTATIARGRRSRSLVRLGSASHPAARLGAGSALRTG